jgi:hypothetical protein
MQVRARMARRAVLAVVVVIVGVLLLGHLVNRSIQWIGPCGYYGTGNGWFLTDATRIHFSKGLVTLEWESSPADWGTYRRDTTGGWVWEKDSEIYQVYPSLRGLLTVEVAKDGEKYFFPRRGVPRCLMPRESPVDRLPIQ